MAWHYCHEAIHRDQYGAEGKRFWVGTPGRPPKRCNDCRGITNDPTPNTVSPGWGVPVTDPTPVIDLPNNAGEPTVANLPTDHFTVIEDAGKTNFYEGDCVYCGSFVAKTDGYRIKVRMINGDEKWKVRHVYCTGPTNIVSEPSEPITVIDPATGDIAAEVSRITGEIVDPIVKRNVDRAITAFVNDTLPPMLKAAFIAAEVQRHEFVINGEIANIEGTTNKAFPELMIMLTAGVPGKRLNVALPGPAGSGKSYMAVQAAKAMSLPIGIISFGPITDTSKLFGYMNATGDYVRTPFREIWEFGGIMLLDEMDNAHPGLLAELNQALAGDVAAFADGMVNRHPDFRAIATMNTYGKGPDRLYAGRNQLDAATLNRFVTLEIGYDEALERRMALAFATPDNETVINRWVDFVQATRRKAEDQKLALIFGPRNTEQGAMLLANGMAWDRVVEAAMFASVSAEVRTKIEVRV